MLFKEVVHFIWVFKWMGLELLIIFAHILMTASSVMICPVSFVILIICVLYFLSLSVLLEVCQSFEWMYQRIHCIYFYMDSVFNFIDVCSYSHYIFSSACFPSAWVYFTLSSFWGESLDDQFENFRLLMYLFRAVHFLHSKL